MYRYYTHTPGSQKSRQSFEEKKSLHKQLGSPNLSYTCVSLPAEDILKHFEEKSNLEVLLKFLFTGSSSQLHKYVTVN